MKIVKSQNEKGFTLVEIMIVVVIIGLLAAMAIPAFQKVRENSVHSTMDNDASLIASSAQQFYMESGETSVTLQELVDEDYLGDLSRGVTMVDPDLTMDADFELTHDQAGGVRTYNGQGIFQSMAD